MDDEFGETANMLWIRFVVKVDHHPYLPPVILDE